MDRQKGLGDLALLLDDYVELEDERRFDEPALAGVDWSERPAFSLGMNLRAICAARHLVSLREFVRRTPRTRRKRTRRPLPFAARRC